LVAKKGGRITHHFAHYVQGECRPETVAHFLAKQFIAQRILSALANNQEVPIRWNCSKCSDTHEGNLVKKVGSIALEHNLGVFRPDVALLDNTGRVIGVIEIVVTHKPGGNMLKYCLDHDIVMIQKTICSASELVALRNSPIFEAEVALCTRKICRDCGSPLLKKQQVIINTSCWNCGGSMNITLISAEGHFIRGPDNFSKEEVAWARQHGAVLHSRYSSKMRRRFLANVCAKCNTVVDNLSLLKYGSVSSRCKGPEKGYFCKNCCGKDTAVPVLGHDIFTTRFVSLSSDENWPAST
jgi:hypothetical protein